MTALSQRRTIFLLAFLASLMLGALAVGMMLNQSTTKTLESETVPDFASVPESLTQPIPNRVVIPFVSATTEQERLAYIEEHVAGQVVETISIGQTVWYVVDTTKPVTATTWPDSPYLASIGGDPDFRDYYAALQQTPTPDDPYYPDQQGVFALMDVPSDWYTQAADNAVIVAVLDSGACLGHADLNGRLVLEAMRDYVDGDTAPQDEYAPRGHGCAITSLIGADTNNGIGMSGLATDSISVLPMRVLNSEGIGAYSDIASAIVDATDFATERGISLVINLSLGGTNSAAILEDAIAYALDNGVRLVAAAGNTGNSTMLYPASHPNVISVGSVNVSGEISAFSSQNTSIDVYAPGEALPAAHISGDYATFTGTSFATAYASAGVALAQSMDASLTFDGSILSLASLYDDSDNGVGDDPVIPTDPVVTEPPIIPDDVRQAFDDNTQVEIIIGLNTGAIAQATDEARVQAIALAQDALVSQMAQMDAGDFAELQRYTSVPVMAARITEDGLSQLETLPEVRGIQLNYELVAHNDDDIATSPEASEEQETNDTTSPIHDDAQLKIADVGDEGNGQTIYIIDTGIDSDHPAFVDRKTDIRGECFNDSCATIPNPQYIDEHGHGTHVAETMGG